jgi:outer membrane protein
MKNNFSKILLSTLLLGSVACASYTTPSDAYKAAIENSTKISSSKYQFQSREEGLNSVYSQLYPQIDGSISYSRTDYERNELLKSRDPYVKEESTDFNISLNQIIYDPVLFSQIDVEESRVKLYSYDYEIAKQKLASETLDIYMSVLNSKNKISLLKASLDYVNQNLQMIEKKYSMNLVSKMDYLKVNVEFQKSKIALMQEEKNYDLMFIKLKDITKMDDIEIPDINLDSLSENFINNILDVVNNNSNIDKNLDMLQSQTAIEMSSYDVKSAKAEHLPSLGFNASYTEYVSDDSTSDYENYGRAMVKLRIPIFEGGAISSKVRAKQLIKKAAQEDLKTTEDETIVMLDENVNNLKFQIDTIKMYKEALVSGQTYLDSIQLAYENGLKSIVELYDAKNKLFEIKYEYMKSIHEMANSYVKFLVLTNNLDNLDLIDNLVKNEK